MGLDISLMKESTPKQNSKGQTYWTVTVIATASNIWSLIGAAELKNCHTARLTGKELWDLKDYIDDNEREWYTDMLEEGKVINAEDKIYSIRGWW